MPTAEAEWSDLLTPVADQRVKKHGKMKRAEIARKDIKEKLQCATYARMEFISHVL